VETNEETALYDRMMAHAPALTRWAAGQVLSRTQEPEQVSLALHRLAGRERDEGRLEQARYYLEWAPVLCWRSSPGVRPV
jgi:hypothetical protein